MLHALYLLRHAGWDWDEEANSKTDSNCLKSGDDLDTLHGPTARESSVLSTTLSKPCRDDTLGHVYSWINSVFGAQNLTTGAAGVAAGAGVLGAGAGSGTAGVAAAAAATVGVLATSATSCLPFPLPLLVSTTSIDACNMKMCFWFSSDR